MEGGSANDYDYCSGDPINCSDPSGLADHNPVDYSLDELSGWGCERLWNYVKSLAKEIGTRDADFRRNKKGYDYDSKGYTNHVYWYQKVQSQLSLARLAYDRNCGGLSPDAWQKLDKWINKAPDKLGHPGIPEWRWILEGGGGVKWGPIPIPVLVPV